MFGCQPERCDAYAYRTRTVFYSTYLHVRPLSPLSVWRCASARYAVSYALRRVIRVSLLKAGCLYGIVHKQTTTLQPSYTCITLTEPTKRFCWLAVVLCGASNSPLLAPAASTPRPPTRSRRTLSRHFIQNHCGSVHRSQCQYIPSCLIVSSRQLSKA